MKHKTIFFACIGWIFSIPQSKAHTTRDTNRVKKQYNITTIYTEAQSAPFHQWQNAPHTVDTTLHSLQYYTTPYSLGNTGLPYVPLIFNDSPNPVGFYYGANYVTSQLYSDANIPYYNTRAPYTRFYYVTDPKIHQFIHFIHSRNIGKNFNFAVEFQRTRSQGTYLNQGTNINQLTLAINYHLKRYTLFANGMLGWYKLNQNGGIVNDSNVADPAYTDRQTVAVNLNAARSYYLNRSFHIKQYYFFGYHSSDSSYRFPLLYVSHSLKLSGNALVYSDPGPLNPAFYNALYADSLSTYDSVYYTQLFNDVAIGSAKAWPSLLRWEAGVAARQVHFKNSYTDSVFHNFIGHVCIYDTGKVLYNVQGQEVVSGSQQGDMNASACIGLRLDSLRSVRVKGGYSLQTPPLIYELYYGNNLRWLNHFGKTNLSSVACIYKDIKWRLNIELQAAQMSNMPYFTVDATPRQYAQAIQVLSAHLQKNFTVGKWHWNTDDRYQYVPNSVPLRLPTFVLENSLFYENWLFHHALLLKVGADVYYNTAYYGYAYMPITGQYYVENQALLGNYVYLDPFVSFRIKTFRMFLKLENAGSRIIGSSYFYALHYPTTDRVLRLGISWDFWN